MAGGFEVDGFFHDTHAHPVAQDALLLLEEVAARTAVPGVLLERDDLFPSEQELVRELNGIAAAVGRGNARRKGSVAPAATTTALEAR